MLSKVLSSSVIGIEAHTVEVEVDISSRGLPHFSMVGLPDAAVKEPGPGQGSLKKYRF
jgi:magnesium chelatase family protein